MDHQSHEPRCGPGRRRGGFLTGAGPAGQAAALQDNQAAILEAKALGATEIIMVVGGLPDFSVAPGAVDGGPGTGPVRPGRRRAPCTWQRCTPLPRSASASTPSVSGGTRSCAGRTPGPSPGDASPPTRCATATCPPYAEVPDSVKARYAELVAPHLG